MQCPNYASKNVIKNGHRYEKQYYFCKQCNRQSVETYSERGYSEDAKQICLRMYCNDMGFRAIERCTGVSHYAVINWVRATGAPLTEVVLVETIPEVGELDELQTFVGSKKTRFGYRRQ